VGAGADEPRPCLNADRRAPGGSPRPTVRLDGDEMAADADDGDACHAFETLKSRR
jgi:hypothetical protein